MTATNRELPWKQFGPDRSQKNSVYPLSFLVTAPSIPKNNGQTACGQLHTIESPKSKVEWRKNESTVAFRSKYLRRASGLLKWGGMPVSLALTADEC